MMARDFNPSVWQEGLGALAIVGCLLFSPLLRPWYRNWNASESERTRSLPGDERVPVPRLQSTRAITIQAPAASVWPWLLQMGQGRGGLYSYERLENLVGCRMRNAGRVMAEYQQLAVGDRVRLTPEGRGPSFEVATIEPGRALVLAGDDPPTTWVFVLAPIDAHSTRLLTRFRQTFEFTVANLVGWRVLTDPINFVMERKMLQGIKLRVEGTAAAN